MDYFNFMRVVNDNLLGDEETKNLFTILENGNFNLASSIVNNTLRSRNIEIVDDIVNHDMLLVSNDRSKRPFNILLEIIENSIISMGNNPSGIVNISITENKFIIEDNGFGMSPSTVYEALLAPGVTGWVKNGIVNKENLPKFTSGSGFVIGLYWCNKVIIETREKNSKSISIELSKKGQSISIDLYKDNTFNNIGTRVSGEINQNCPIYGDGPARNVRWGGDWNLLLSGVLRRYCRFVNKRIHIYHNGKIINDGQILGVKPISIYLKRDLDAWNWNISVNSSTINPDKDSLDYYSQRSDFDCFFEFYRNGLFLYYISYDEILTNLLCQLRTLKIVNITPVQKNKINQSIIRIFLPGNFPLLNSHLGLPYMLEASIIEKILDNI